MYDVTITKPTTNETISKQCKNSAAVVDFINNTLFSGIPITNLNIVYSLLSRPHVLKVPYRDLVTINRDKPIVTKNITVNDTHKNDLKLTQ